MDICVEESFADGIGKVFSTLIKPLTCTLSTQNFSDTKRMILFK